MTLQGLPIFSYSENPRPHHSLQDCTQLSSLLFPSDPICTTVCFPHGLQLHWSAHYSSSMSGSLLPQGLCTSYFLFGTFSPQIPSTLTPLLPSNAHLYVTSVKPCLTYFKTGLIHPLPISSNPLLWHRGYLEQCLAITKNSINIQL